MARQRRAQGRCRRKLLPARAGAISPAHGDPRGPTALGM